ncbi:hypothetical protein Bbelb_325320 [Branchiostoma belcheri]|nr:hypothetical protein Bbelb_325320 [Branchiostoma belcheri]
MCRSASSEEDNSVTTDNVTSQLQHVIPPIENSAYHRVGPSQEQDSNNISLARMLPPIPNAMYHRQRNTGIPQPPDSGLAQIIPPIENTAYHRNRNTGVAQQDSTDISLSQIVPPISNAMYHRQRNAGIPQPPDSGLAQIIPPIENAAYHRNCNTGVAQQESTDISLSQIVPPISNAMYHRQCNTGIPQSPDSDLAQIIPPIENTAYHRNGGTAQQHSTDTSLSQIVPPVLTLENAAPGDTQNSTRPRLNSNCAALHEIQPSGHNINCVTNSPGLASLQKFPHTKILVTNVDSPPGTPSNIQAVQPTCTVSSILQKSEAVNDLDRRKTVSIRPNNLGMESLRNPCHSKMFATAPVAVRNPGKGGNPSRRPLPELPIGVNCPQSTRIHPSSPEENDTASEHEYNETSDYEKIP